MGEVFKADNEPTFMIQLIYVITAMEFLGRND